MLGPKPKTIVRKEEWQRWNDYGIGLFLQGDLKGAAAAFQKVTEADPSNPDGWVNIGRCAVQEGDMAAGPNRAGEGAGNCRRILRAQISSMPKCSAPTGTTQAPPARLRSVLEQYPRDRVALNDSGAHSVPAAQI